MMPLSLFSPTTLSVFSVHTSEDKILSVALSFRSNIPPQARYWRAGCGGNKVGVFLAACAYVRVLPSALHNNSLKKGQS